MKTILLIAFTFIFSLGYSQDLIITSEGDSLNCKITKEKSDVIYFTFKYKEEIRNTLLPKDQIKFYKYNFYQQGIVPVDKIKSSKAFPRLMLAVNGGWSYRTARAPTNIPTEFREYVNELKTGYNFGGEVAFYISEPLGLGLKFCDYKSSNEIPNIYRTNPNGIREYGRMSDDISIIYFGPTFNTRLFNSNKTNAIVSKLSIGYLGYNNNAVVINSFNIKGSTVGLLIDLGYDIALSKKLSIGFTASYIMGTLFNYTVSDGTKTETVKLKPENYDTLTRIDISIGVRFNK